MTRSTWRYDLAKRYLNEIYEYSSVFGHPGVAKVFRKTLMTEQDGGVVIPIHESLGEIDNVVLPSEVVKHFIRSAAHRWIMKECICRTAGNCERYSAELGCIFLGEATTRISPKLGRSVSCDEALAHLEKCEEAGLIHLIGRLKIDAMAMDVKPYDRLLGICNCCECCCIFRAIPKMHRSLDVLRRLEGVNVSVGDACLACGECTTSCFVDGLSVYDGKAQIADSCKGCGRCVRACPNDAITLTITGSNVIEAEVARLSAVVDV